MKRMVMVIRPLTVAVAVLVTASLTSAQGAVSNSSAAASKAIAPSVQGGTPEPATALLVGGAAAGYLYLRSRRRRDRAPQAPAS